MDRLASCSILILLAFTCLDLPGATENIVVPIEANVVNIKDEPFGAKGDGTNDDTKAISDALGARGRRTVCFPNGTYLVSAPIQFGGIHTIQGESTEGVTIRLKDGTPAFSDTHSAVPLITACGRIRSIRNVTINTGSANPGAVGVMFMAEKEGSIRDCVVVSADGSGRMGIDLGFRASDRPSDSGSAPGTNVSVGPVHGACLLKNVGISGFSEGVSADGNGDSIVFENIRLENIRGRGIVNNGAVMAIHALRGNTAAAALDNASVVAVTSLVDTELEGSMISEKVPAVINSGMLFVRNLKAKRYAMAIQNNEGSAADEMGNRVNEWVSHGARNPADVVGAPVLEIKDAPETRCEPLDKWASVTQCPPVVVQITLDGQKVSVPDYTRSFQDAIDSGKPVVYFPTSVSNYYIGGNVRIRGKVSRIVGFRAHFLPTRKGGGEAYRGTLVVDEGDVPSVVIEDFDWTGVNMDVEHCARTLVLRDIGGGGRYAAREDAGQLFMENVNIMPASFGVGQKVWGRQVHVESATECKLLNDGARLWMLGLKGENKSSLVTTRSGGTTEIVGALACLSGSASPNPLFVVEKGVSFSCNSVTEWLPTGNDIPWVNLVSLDGGRQGPLLKRGEVLFRRDDKDTAVVADKVPSVISFYRLPKLR